MIVKLENREYEFLANGKFLMKYQDNFHENLVVALYKVAMEKDPLTCLKIVYSGINEELPFEEWLDTFETPLFILEEMDKIYEYVTRSIQPTVELKGDNSNKENGEKKTKIN